MFVILYTLRKLSDTYKKSKVSMTVQRRLNILFYYFYLIIQISSIPSHYGGHT